MKIEKFGFIKLLKKLTLNLASYVHIKFLEALIIIYVGSDIREKNIMHKKILQKNCKRIKI